MIILLEFLKLCVISFISDLSLNKYKHLYLPKKEKQKLGM